jgi:hypothetical protein
MAFLDPSAACRSVEVQVDTVRWARGMDLLAAHVTDERIAGSPVECTVRIGAHEIIYPDGSTSTLQVRNGESVHGGR